MLSSFMLGDGRRNAPISSPAHDRMRPAKEE
jgi:hypothetical protein